MAEAVPPASSPLRFNVLGPLQVCRGDTELPLGRLQQRVVLALLLLRGGRPFPRDQFIDAVWGESAPTYAVNLLQKHVSLLRHTLEPDPAPDGRARLLGWTDAGYVLMIPADGVDLHRFEREVQKGRRARDAGDLEVARSMFHDALRLWRGRLCDGLHNPLLDAERDRLEELRIGILEDRVEVESMLGRDGDSIAELRRLVREHPLRERLRGSLMLSLHRAGRTGEALEAYRDTRHHLRRELGIDPSPELKRLHARILAGDPGLVRIDRPDRTRLSVETTPSTRPSEVPAQLPHRVPDFTGRRAHLMRLDAALAATAGPPSETLITAIAGSAGVGKTTLAIAWAHQIKNQFPDGQLYVNLRGFDPAGSPMEAGEAVRGFLDALDVPTQRVPVTVEAQCALYRSLLADRRMLVVLDNARSSDQVRPLLPGSSSCLVIVTSRRDLTGLVAGDGAVPLTLDLLTDAESADYLSRRLGLERVARDPTAVADLVGLCARLPLALAILAARAATRPDFSMRALAAELHELGGALDAFDGGDDGTDIRRVFSWSQTGLSPAAARAFRLLGLHPGPQISVGAASALVEQPLGRTRKVLAELARAHLVEEVAPSRFAFHDLLRSYACELVEETEGQADRDAARGRLLDFYRQTAQRADRLLSPRRCPELWLSTDAVVSPTPLKDAIGALDWFRAEHRALLAVTGQAAAAHLDVATYQLCWALATYLDREYQWRDLQRIQLIALGAARRLMDPRAEAYAERGLARAHTWQGRFAEADTHYDRALELFGLVGDQIGTAQTHYSLGWIRGLQDQFHVALRHAQIALEILRASGPVEARADTLNEVGWFYAQLGDADAALRYCREALTLHQQTGHRDGEAQTLDSLGFIHHTLGRFDEAVRCYREAAVCWSELSDRYYEAAALLGLGEVFRSAHRIAEAREVWERSRALYAEMADPAAAKVQCRLDRLTETGDRDSGSSLTPAPA